MSSRHRRDTSTFPKFGSHRGSSYNNRDSEFRYKHTDKSNSHGVSYRGRLTSRLIKSGSYLNKYNSIRSDSIRRHQIDARSLISGRIASQSDVNENPRGRKTELSSRITHPNLKFPHDKQQEKYVDSAEMFTNSEFEIERQIVSDEVMILNDVEESKCSMPVDSFDNINDDAFLDDYEQTFEREMSPLIIHRHFGDERLSESREGSSNSRSISPIISRSGSIENHLSRARYSRQFKRSLSNSRRSVSRDKMIYGHKRSVVPPRSRDYETRHEKRKRSVETESLSSIRRQIEREREKLRNLEQKRKEIRSDFSFKSLSKDRKRSIERTLKSSPTHTSHDHLEHVSKIEPALSNKKLPPYRELKTSDAKEKLDESELNNSTLNSDFKNSKDNSSGLKKDLSLISQGENIDMREMTPDTQSLLQYVHNLSPISQTECFEKKELLNEGGQDMSPVSKNDHVVYKNKKSLETELQTLSPISQTSMIEKMDFSQSLKITVENNVGLSPISQTGSLGRSFFFQEGELSPVSQNGSFSKDDEKYLQTIHTDNGRPKSTDSMHKFLEEYRYSDESSCSLASFEEKEDTNNAGKIFDNYKIVDTNYKEFGNKLIDSTYNTSSDVPEKRLIQNMKVKDENLPHNLYPLLLNYGTDQNVSSYNSYYQSNISQIETYEQCDGRRREFDHDFNHGTSSSRNNLFDLIGRRDAEENSRRRNLHNFPKKMQNVPFIDLCEKSGKTQLIHQRLLGPKPSNSVMQMNKSLTNIYSASNYERNNQMHAEGQHLLTSERLADNINSQVDVKSLSENTTTIQNISKQNLPNFTTGNSITSNSASAFQNTTVQNAIRLPPVSIFQGFGSTLTENQTMNQTIDVISSISRYSVVPGTVHNTMQSTPFQQTYFQPNQGTFQNPNLHTFHTIQPSPMGLLSQAKSQNSSLKQVSLSTVHSPQHQRPFLSTTNKRQEGYQQAENSLPFQPKRFVSNLEYQRNTSSNFNESKIIPKTHFGHSENSSSFVSDVQPISDLARLDNFVDLKHYLTGTFKPGYKNVLDLNVRSNHDQHTDQYCASECFPSPEYLVRFKDTPPSPEILGNILDKFVIFFGARQTSDLEKDPYIIIIESFVKSDRFGGLDIYEELQHNQLYSFALIWKGVMLSRAIGSTKEEARKKASISLINSLAQTCYTIQAKYSYYCGGKLPQFMFTNPEAPGVYKVIGRQELIVSVKDVLKMLRDRGVDTTFTGFKGVDATHINVVLNLIDDFFLNDEGNYCELIFGGKDLMEYTSREMKTISDHVDKHRCLEWRRSSGFGHGRYIAVSRKISPQQLLKYLQSRNNENIRYKLLPPQSFEFHNDSRGDNSGK